LIAPSDVIAPYDMALAKQSRTFRDQWAQAVAAQLIAATGPLEGLAFEVHAGAAYVEPLSEALRGLGASVLAPLRGLSQGQHLAWYGQREDRATRQAPADQAIDNVITRLSGPAIRARQPTSHGRKKRCSTSLACIRGGWTSRVPRCSVPASAYPSHRA